jgi:hypothetical protein
MSTQIAPIDKEIRFATTLFDKKSFHEDISRIREKYSIGPNRELHLTMDKTREFLKEIDDMCMSYGVPMHIWADYIFHYICTGVKEDFKSFLKKKHDEIVISSKENPLFLKYKKDEISSENLNSIIISYATKDCIVTVDDLHSFDKGYVLGMRLKDIEESYPVNIRFSPDANDDDIIQFIKDEKDRIELFRNLYSKQKREVHSGLYIEVEDIVYKERTKIPPTKYKDIVPIIQKCYKDKGISRCPDSFSDIGYLRKVFFRVKNKRK